MRAQQGVQAHPKCKTCHGQGASKLYWQTEGRIQAGPDSRQASVDPFEYRVAESSGNNALFKQHSLSSLHVLLSEILLQTRTYLNA